MEKSKLDYSCLFQLTPTPILVYDLHTYRILDVNKAAISHYGYTKEEFLSLNIDTIHYKKDLSVFLEAHQSILEEKETIDLGVFVHQTKKVKLTHMEVKAHCIDFENKKSVLLICQEVSFSIHQKLEVSQMIDSSLDVFCVVDNTNSFVYVSGGCYDHWGYLPEELIGKSVHDLIIEEDIAKTNDTITAIQKGQKIKSFTNRYKKKNGEIAYNLWSATWDHNSGLRYAVARDCEEKIKQEEKIILSEQRFKALVQEGSDMISIFYLQGNYIYTSPTTTAILDITPEEFEGKSVFEFIHPEDFDIISESLQKIQTEYRVIVKPFRLKSKNNKWRWIETVLTNMSENIAVQGIVANSRDITKQKKEEQQLKLLESVVTKTKDAVLITEAESLDEPGPRIIYVNDAFTKMTGYSAKEIIGKSPRILQGPNSDKKELEKLSNALRKWETCEITTINYKKNGDEFWINISMTPVSDEKGWYTHWIAIERDVTEQKTKEIEKELLAQISKNFNVTNDYITATNKLCKTISEFGRFDWVEIWTSNTEKNRLQLLNYYVAAKEDKIFYDNSSDIESFKINEGLAGKVWQNKSQVLWKDILNNKSFLRKDSAKKIGLQAVLGIPLLFNDKVIGVLKIGIKNDENQLEKISPLFKQLEAFIGSELNRKKLENELSQILNTIPDIMSLVDFKGKILKINKVGCDLLGYSEEEILGQSFEKYIHPEDKEAAFNELASLKSGLSTLELENRYITKTGQIIWLSWTTNSVVEEGIVFATARNITEEKKLRELIRQTNNLAKIGSWEIDLKNQTHFWSNEVHQLHETNPKSYVPNLETSINFYREDFHKMVQSNVKNCINLGKPFDYEAVIVTANKQEKWVRAMGTAEIINGVCVRIYGSFQNISERKEAEIKLQSLANNLPGLVYQYLIYPDGTDKINYATKGTKEIWGYSAEEVLKNNQIVWKNIANGGDIERVKKSISESIKTKSQWTSRWKYVMPNGEIKTHLGYGSPTFLSDGSVLFNSVILDITQEAKNEALLEQVTKQAKIGSWVTDLVKGEHFSSDVACSILEIGLKQIIPDMESTINYFREDYRPMAKSKIMECIKLGSSFDFEAVIVTPNKREKWIRTIGSAEMINGQCVKIYGSIQDISSLKFTENRLVSLSDNLPGVVFQYLIRPDGTDSLRYVSSGVEQLWGFTAKETMENKNLIWDQIKLGGNVEEMQNSIAQSVETKSKWSCRIKYVMPTGELRTHLGYGTPDFLADGTIIFNSIILDITQEVKNEELLEQTTIISRIGSWELDLINHDEDTMTLSPMIREILEIDENYNPSYTSCLELHVEESKNRLQKSMRLLIIEGIEFDIELLLHTAKGNERWVRCIGKSEMVNNQRTKIYGSLQDITDKKVAAEKLKKSLEDKSTILESIGDAFFAVDNNWIVTYWNKEAELVLGRKKEDILGKNLWEEYPDAVDTQFYTHYNNAVTTKQATYFEPYYPTLNMWLEVSAYPSPEGLSVYFKNVTIRKEVEQIKNNLQTTLENSLNEIYIFDLETFLFSYVNKGALNNLGYSNEEIITMTPLDLKPDFTEKKFKKLLKPLLKNENEKIIFFTTHKRKDASLYPVEIHLQLIKEGNIRTFLAIVLDITERKKSEASVLLANERFEKVTEATKDAIWDWDIVNDTYYRSKAIEKFFGNKTMISFKEKDFWKDKFHKEDLPKIKASVYEAINNPSCTRWEMEYRLINDQDKTLYVIDRGVIIRDSDKKAIRMVGAMTDITEQKQMTLQLSELNKSLQQHANELERSNEELEQFAYIASHDLQEPLRMVTSFLTLIEKRYGTILDEKGLQYINFAVDGARNMRQIILDLLTYSKISTLDDSNENVALEELIKDICLLQSRLIKEKKAKIHVENLPQVFSIKHYLLQLFQNIISNALKYAKDDTPLLITISSKNYKTHYIICVKDNGIGIEKEYFEKIFILFQRLHTKDEFQGNGMGLAIAKKIIDKLNGKIWVESELGIGSSFYIQIPKKNN